MLGRAARLIEGPPPPYKRCIRERSFARKLLLGRKMNNDYPERWITWLVGR